MSPSDWEVSWRRTIADCLPPPYHASFSPPLFHAPPPHLSHAPTASLIHPSLYENSRSSTLTTTISLVSPSFHLCAISVGLGLAVLLPLPLSYYTCKFTCEISRARLLPPGSGETDCSRLITTISLIPPFLCETSRSRTSSLMTTSFLIPPSLWGQ